MKRVLVIGGVLIGMAVVGVCQEEVIAVPEKKKEAPKIAINKTVERAPLEYKDGQFAKNGTLKWYKIDSEDDSRIRFRFETLDASTNVNGSVTVRSGFEEIDAEAVKLGYIEEGTSMYDVIVDILQHIAKKRVEALEQ